MSRLTVNYVNCRLSDVETWRTAAGSWRTCFLTEEDS